MGSREFQYLRITPEQAQEIRMRCLNWVTAMHSAGFLLPMTKERVTDFAKEIEGWTFGGFAPIVTQPTPMGTIEEAAYATRSRCQEILDGLPETSLGKRAAIREAMAIWERFMADIAAAIVMPSL